MTAQYRSTATFRQNLCKGKLLLQSLVVKAMPVPFILGKVQTEEREVKRMNKLKHKWNIQTASMSSLPQLPNSEPLLPWPIGTLSVKLVNQIPGDLQMLCWFPAHPYLVVTGPLDDIVQLLIGLCRVEYAVNFTFLYFLHYCRGWLSRWLTADWHCITIQKWVLENVVVVHCSRQV